MNKTDLRTQSVSVYVALDIGWQIKLPEAARLFHAQQIPIQFAHWYRRSEKTPLSITRQIAPFVVHGRSTEAFADVTFFEVGGVSVRYGLAVGSASLDDLSALSSELSDNEMLAGEARKLVRELITIAGPAIVQPSVIEECPFEDYTLFRLCASRNEPLRDALTGETGAALARIVKGVTYPLDSDRVREIQSLTEGWSRDDLCIIDWRSALILEPEGAEENEVLDWAEETLEYANMQLVQLKGLEALLDAHVDWARRQLDSWWISKADRRRVRLLSIDCAEIFDEVQSGLGLFEHQFLRSVHRRAAERFELADIMERIRQKLANLNQIESGLTADTQGLLSLGTEITIIVLFVLSIVIEVFWL